MLVDGHLRAETTPDAVVPVLILDVSNAEADKIPQTTADFFSIPFQRTRRGFKRAFKEIPVSSCG
jgi:hypothetical protein